MDDPSYVVIVAGMGRCGTSLVMKMLDKGGIPPFQSEAPGYENVTIRDAMQRADYSWCEAAKGHALKVLEPFRYKLPPRSRVDCRVIWLDRKLEAQARSWLAYKLRRGVIGPPRDPNRWVKEQKRYLNDGRRKSMAHLSALGHPWIGLHLEDIQADARAGADAIQKFLDRELDVTAMSYCVLPPELRGNVPA